MSALPLRAAAAFALPWAVLAAALGAQAGLPGRVRTIAGATFDGALAVADGAARVQTADGERRFDLAELAAFAPTGAASKPVAAPHRVWLRSGLDLPATALAGLPAANGVPARLVVTLPAGVDVAVPLAMVRALRHGGAERPEPALFAADRKQPLADADLLYVVRDGKAQRSAVTLRGFGASTVDFTLRGDEYEFATAGVAAVLFGDATGAAPDRQPKPRARLQLASGEALDGKLLALSADGARLRLDEGVEVAVPAAAVFDLQMQSDRMVWLSDLQPKVEQTPAFDRVWLIGVDRTPAGKGLQLGGVAHARGLCLVPRARLTYDLGGRFDVFEAIVGIDDRAGPDAHALLRVLVDGVVVWDGGARTRGQQPEALRLELKKAKSLALEADFGRNYDLGDFCVFADARLVQQ
ncbi:MAG: NPCBM/NEW2 domain-containing protein [Planctomycetota bacterium]